jgi:hypothetical protein
VTDGKSREPAWIARLEAAATAAKHARESRQRRLGSQGAAGQGKRLTAGHAMQSDTARCADMIKRCLDAIANETATCLRDVSPMMSESMPACHFLGSLNEAQRAAAEHGLDGSLSEIGPLLVIAGAGSGKTWYDPHFDRVHATRTYAGRI